MVAAAAPGRREAAVEQQIWGAEEGKRQSRLGQQRRSMLRVTARERVFFRWGGLLGCILVALVGRR
jgi:hypothetical protein